MDTSVLEARFHSTIIPTRFLPLDSDFFSNLVSDPANGVDQFALMTVIHLLPHVVDVDVHDVGHGVEGEIPGRARRSWLGVTQRPEFRVADILAATKILLGSFRLLSRHA